MRRLQLTIEALCLGIALLAVDIVIWKSDLSSYDVWVVVGMRGTLVASSVLAFALADLLRGRGSRSFLAGFLVAGFSMEFVYWVCCGLAPWQVLAYVQNPVDQALFGFYFDAIPGFHQALMSGSPSARLLFEMTCFPLMVTIHSLPVLAVAVVGGWVSRKRAVRVGDSPSAILSDTPAVL